MAGYFTENYCETGKYNLQGVYLLLEKEYVVHPSGKTAKIIYRAKVGMSHTRMYERPNKQTRGAWGTRYVDMEGNTQYTREFKSCILLREKCYLPNYIDPWEKEFSYHRVLSEIGAQEGWSEWYRVSEEEYNNIYNEGLAYLRKFETFFREE